MAAGSRDARRVAHFVSAFALAVAAAFAVGVWLLQPPPDRHLELSGFAAATLLAGALGGALALAFSPEHRGVRLLIDALVAAALWAGYTFATWKLVMLALENVFGWGLLFVLWELLVFWSLLGAGLILLVCVPSVRRERGGRAGPAFTAGRTAIVVALACGALVLPRIVLGLGAQSASPAATPDARPADAALPAPTTAGFSVRVAAHVRFVPNGANQTIASRPLEQGQQQFPWLFRVDTDSKLAVGMNLVGTDLTYCSAAAPLHAGEHDVGFSFDGSAIRIAVDGEEVARCSTSGALGSSGEVLWGRVRHFRSASDAQAFLGDLSSTFVEEMPLHSTSALTR